jgi:hypothetical protein
MARWVPVDTAFRSMSIMLLAVLVLLARLLGPALPGVAIDKLAGGPALVICHAVGDDAPAPSPAKHTHEHDCQLCPACHLAALAAIIPPATTVSVPVAIAVAGQAAPLPPTTGPPHAGRLAARPTGPPTILA